MRSRNTKRELGGGQTTTGCQVLCTFDSCGRPGALAGHVSKCQGVPTHPAPPVHKHRRAFSAVLSGDTWVPVVHSRARAPPPRDHSTRPVSAQPSFAAAQAPRDVCSDSHPPQNTWFWKTDSCACWAADAGTAATVRSPGLPGTRLDQTVPAEAGRGILGLEDTWS